MAFFNPQLFGNTPVMQPGTETIVQPPLPEPPAPVDMGAVMPTTPITPAPQIVEKPIFVPVLVQKKAEKKKITFTPEISRKAQGIYPMEQAQKQQKIDNAKMPNTQPLGAWGKPE